MALRQYGLEVTFFSDPDPSPHFIERSCHRLAEIQGIRMAGAATLDEILAMASTQVIAVILYDTD